MDIESLETEEGMAAVNTIGPYVLTKLLAPHFPAGKGGHSEDNRIIFR